MRPAPECPSCLARLAAHCALVATDDGEREAVAIETALRRLTAIEEPLPPPVLGRVVCRAVAEVTGNADPYAAEKTRFTESARAVLPRLRERVEASDDPLAAAVRLAIAGNIIDFGQGSGWQDEAFRRAVDEALAVPLAVDRVDALRAALARPGPVLYVLDNAGEAELDRLLIERIGPERVVAVARGGPILNDFTVEDARASGFADLVRVLSSGSDLAGLSPAEAPPEVRRLLDEAAVVLSKGQGNFEMLHDADIAAPAFFLLRVKCAPVARVLGVGVGSWVVAER